MVMLGCLWDSGGNQRANSSTPCGQGVNEGNEGKHEEVEKKRMLSWEEGDSGREGRTGITHSCMPVSVSRATVRCISLMAILMLSIRM